MNGMVNDNIAGQMVSIAYGKLYDMINHQKNVPEEIKEKSLENIKLLFTEEMLDHGLAWRPSNFMIYGFTDCNLETMDFNYDYPLPFQQFVNNSVGTLQQIFDLETITQAIMQLKHSDPKVRYFGAETIYKGYFGYVLFTLMIKAFYGTQWLPSKGNDIGVRGCESMIFNMWWDDLVNYVPFEVISLNQITMQEDRRIIYVRPTIAVTINRQVQLGKVQLVDYTAFLNGFEET